MLHNSVAWISFPYIMTANYYCCLPRDSHLHSVPLWIQAPHISIWESDKPSWHLQYIEVKDMLLDTMERIILSSCSSRQIEIKRLKKH